MPYIREPLETVASGSSARHRSTGTAVYLAHEDSEHRATPQSDRAVGFQGASEQVLSGLG